MDSNKYWAEFDIEHARYIIKENLRPQESWAEPDFVDNWYRTWQGRLWAYTLMVDETPVACVGLALQEWGKAEAWALFSASFQEHILTIYRTIKAGLAVAYHKHNLVRIQATIDPGWPANVKWIESLGFQYEGRLKKWGPNHEDFLMYSRTN